MVTATRRRITSFVMISGLIVSTVFLCVGRIGWRITTARLQSLEQSCNRKPRANNLPKKLPEPNYEGDYPPDLFGWLPRFAPPRELPGEFLPEDLIFDYCTGESLYSLTSDPNSDFKPNEEQTEIALQFARRHWWAQNWDTLLGWAFFTAVILSLPRVWYFLLDRLGEVSAAVRRGQ